MALSDVCHNTDVRFCHFRNPVHLAKLRNSHLNHCHFVLSADAKNRQRQANLIIKISFCFQHVEFLA